MMELKIISPSPEGFIKAIEWNHEEIKQEVATKVEYYKNLVYTDDQIKEAKKDRATLNKFMEALESKRKEIKKQCMEPYNDFETKMKEITAIVAEPIALIDSQVKEYEEKQKVEKQAAIESKFTAAGFHTFVTLEQIFNPKWLNASFSMKKIEEELNEKRIQIESDVQSISNLPEFSFEAMEHYKRTLDLAGAIREGQRLADIQKRKAEQEAERARREAEQAAEMAGQQAEAMNTTSGSVPADNFMQPPAEEPQASAEQEKRWISFAALLSTEDALALKEFFNSRSIEFKAV